MNDYKMWQVFDYKNENIAKTYDEYKKEYFSHPIIEIKTWRTKLFGEKTFLMEERKIPLILWLMLKFKKTIVSEDTEYDTDEWKSVVYAKILFGKVYIMKHEMYKNNILWWTSKLKRKDFYYKRDKFNFIK